MVLAEELVLCVVCDEATTLDSRVSEGLLSGSMGLRHCCPLCAWTWAGNNASFLVLEALERVADAVHKHARGVTAALLEEHLLLRASTPTALGVQTVHVAVLPGADGRLAYWLWFPSPTPSQSVPSLLPLAEPVSGPPGTAARVARRVQGQLLFGRPWPTS